MSKPQAPVFGRILCKSSFSRSNSNSWVENFVCCPYVKESVEHAFKTVSKKIQNKGTI